MTDNDRPFLYHGGRYVTTINVAYNPPKGNTLDGIPFQIHFDSGSIQFSPDDANRILIELATALYDNNHLTMDTAERILYFANATIADTEPPLDHRVIADGWAVDTDGE